MCRAGETANDWGEIETIVDSVSDETLQFASSSSGLPADRFKIGTTVALGGMGRIYQAYDRDLGREVLLKVIEDSGYGLKMLERWGRQREVLQRLNHPAIPAALEVGSSRGSFWVATPRFKGQTLAERLRASGPLSFDSAAAAAQG